MTSIISYDVLLLIFSVLALFEIPAGPGKCSMHLHGGSRVPLIQD